MSVEDNEGHWLSIHDWDARVGTGDATADSDAFDWLRSRYLAGDTRGWALRQRQYRLDGRSVDMRNLTGLHVKGVNSQLSGIVQEDITKPVIQLGRAGANTTSGDRQELSGFRCDYPFNGGIPQTPQATALLVEGVWNTSTIRDILLFNVGRGLAHDGGGQFFSNTIEQFRVGFWSDWAIDLNAPSGSTGNSWDNIYLNNRNPAGVVPAGMFFAPGVCEGVARFSNFPESTFRQFNVEYVEVAQEAITLNQCQEFGFDALHYEGVALPEGGALMGLHGNRTGVNIRNQNVSFCTNAGPAAMLEVDGLVVARVQWTQRDNTGLAQFYATQSTAGNDSANPTGSGSRIYLHPNAETASGIGGPINPAAPVANSTIREWGDFWESLVRTNIVYRVSIDAGGNITAFPV